MRDNVLYLNIYSANAVLAAVGAFKVASSLVEELRHAQNNLNTNVMQKVLKEQAQTVKSGGTVISGLGIVSFCVLF